jgi:hypothetical protein
LAELLGSKVIRSLGERSIEKVLAIELALRMLSDPRNSIS